MFLNIHEIIPVTTVNGPGQRFGIWVQGCNQNCKGCFNPETHDPENGISLSVGNIYEKIIKNNIVEGVSISGGEPLDQHAALFELIKIINENSNLTCLVYTGYTLKEIKERKEYKDLLKYIDILIAGPYIEHLKTHKSLISSSNQSVHLLSDRYSPTDLKTEDLEILISFDGVITITGHQNFD